MTTAVAPANPTPCSACPWRLANQGKPHPHKFYSPANLARLWRQLRNGERMSCHPTDPRMAEFEGYESCSAREQTNECAGALILQQREAMAFQEIAKTAPKGKGLAIYRRERRNGLTRIGLISVIERGLIAWPGQVPMRRDLDLGDVEIGYRKIAIVTATR